MNIFCPIENIKSYARVTKWSKAAMSIGTCAFNRFEAKG